jgi:hypothetical protein
LSVELENYWYQYNDAPIVLLKNLLTNSNCRLKNMKKTSVIAKIVKVNGTSLSVPRHIFFYDELKQVIELEGYFCHAHCNDRFFESYSLPGMEQSLVSTIFYISSTGGIVNYHSNDATPPQLIRNSFF